MKNIFVVISVFIFLSCQGQPNSSTRSDKKKVQDSINCNQNVYGTKKYIKDLPKYVCIPDDFIIDDYLRMSDLDHDGQNDFLAIKYNRKEDDQIDGELTYWRFYLKNKNDTIFRLKHTLSNIVPPFLEDISYQYLAEHTVAEKIFNNYPRRVANRLSFRISQDTLRLSYKFDDAYGKTFVFAFDKPKADWYLEGIEYFIGELPMHWWRDNEFYYPLNSDLLIIETRKPKQKVSIEEFDLVNGFKYRSEELNHLAGHINNIEEKAGTSIQTTKFKECQGIELPSEWVY